MQAMLVYFLKSEWFSQCTCTMTDIHLSSHSSWAACQVCGEGFCELMVRNKVKLKACIYSDGPFIFKEPPSHVDFLSIMMSTYQCEWLVGMLEIFYLHKQYPFAPYNWLAHISCCLPWSITSDESDKALQCSISCMSLSPRSDGMSLSANLSLENQAFQLWHMLKQQQRCDYGMEERCQLLNDPLIYWWKRMRCQNKSGNRLEYIIWSGVSVGLEPIQPVSLKLSCSRISSVERTHVGFKGLCESGEIEMKNRM